MGDGRMDALRVVFDRRLKLEFHGTNVTSDAGLIAHRELDEIAGLTTSLAEQLFDFRTGSNIQHSMTALIRQSLYSKLAGYYDTNDAERLSLDSAIRHVVGGRARERTAASTSQMGRFETDVLTHPDNLQALTDTPGKWVDHMRQAKPPTRIVLDMDSSVSPTYGEQEGTKFNGHFGCTCYHPLFVFNQDGDVERAVLRDGNVHSAEEWRAVLEPVVARYRGVDVPKFFRGDAAFAKPEIYGFLEAEDYSYAIRLPANDTLYEHIEHLMVRPVGRPPKKPIVLYHEFTYQAASWRQARRVVAKVEWHQGELLPRVGFVVTNMSRCPYRVVHFYNQRGIAEQWIREGKHALHWTRLSCHRFDDNQVRLQLFVLAYNQ